jgi:hypothetical protein
LIDIVGVYRRFQQYFSLQQYFSYIVVVSFIGGGNPRTQRNYRSAASN